MFISSPFVLWPSPRCEQKHHLNQWLKAECPRTEILPDLPTSTTGSSVYDAVLLWEGRHFSFPSQWKTSALQLEGRPNSHHTVFKLSVSGGFAITSQSRQQLPAVWVYCPLAKCHHICQILVTFLRRKGFAAPIASIYLHLHTNLCLYEAPACRVHLVHKWCYIHSWSI